MHIRGRVKRFAKIAGEMISLEVVERIAATRFAGFAHAASTRSDAAKGEAIVLFTTDPQPDARTIERRGQESRAAPELAVPRILKTCEGNTAPRYRQDRLRAA